MTDTFGPAAPTANVATLGHDVTMSMLRLRWNDLLTVVAGRSKKAASILREAAVRSVHGRTLTLAFRHAHHANMLAASPDLALLALDELFGGEWRIECEVEGVAGPAVSSDARNARNALPLCERFGGNATVLGNRMGRYLDVGLVTRLPVALRRDDLIVEHGYAVGFGDWFFFADLPPALAFGRAARMSADCNGYGVYPGAVETRNCPRHGDERVLYACNIGPSLDRSGTEMVELDHWLQGVKVSQQSSHWRAPASAPSRAPAVSVPAARLVAAPPTGKRCAVYLHYDADDVLLYVGITDDLVTRGKRHASRSSWTHFAVRHEGVWCDDRRAAERKEVDLIKTLRPLFNDKHAAPDRNERLVAYLAGKGRYDLLAPAITRG